MAVFCPKEGARLRCAGTGTDVGIAADRAVLVMAAVIVLICLGILLPQVVRRKQ